MNEQILKLNITQEAKSEVFGNKIGLLTRIFGCWHRNLSRPMTIDKEAYCVCAKCGARIRFDTENLRTFGSFYHPPMNSLYPTK